MQSLTFFFDEAYRLQVIDDEMYNKGDEDITYADWCKILIHTMESKCIIDGGTGLDYENKTYGELLENIWELEKQLIIDKAAGL